jgi:PAS domain S-box-containing protein
MATKPFTITTQQIVEENFRMTVEASSSGVMIADRGGKIVMVNTEVERLFGYGRKELIGQRVEILIPDRLRPQHIRNRNAFGAQPEVRRMGVGRDLFGLRKDGTEFPVEVGLNPIQIGDELFVLSAIVDISERKHAEEMFRLAVEACPNGMVMIDRTGKIIMINTEIERLFGYARGELVGRTVDILVPERLRQQPCAASLGIRHAAGISPHGCQPRSVRFAQGRHGVSGRSRAQPHSRGFRPAGAERDRRHHRAQAHGAHEGRIRLDCEP